MEHIAEGVLVYPHQVREATLADVPRVVEMAEHFLEDTAYGQLLARPWTLEQLVHTVLEVGVILVVEVAGKLEGMIAIAAVPHPANGIVIAEELAWWVEPAWRSSTIGPRLLVAAELWTTSKRVSMLKMVAPHGSGVAGYYEHRGYVAVETAFVKKLL